MKTSSSTNRRDDVATSFDSGVWSDLQDRMLKVDTSELGLWIDEQLVMVEEKMAEFRSPLSIKKSLRSGRASSKE